MHRKTERPSYALASSSISDIPTPTQKDIHFTNNYDTAEYKQSSSIYQVFSQSRSRMDQGSSLHYSTARPFYEDLGQDYYDRPLNKEKAIYNLQQRNDYNKEKMRSKKSPNKKIMIFSYSNIVLFNNKLSKIISQLKKRTFQTLRKPQALIKNYKKPLSLNSGETNHTFHEQPFYKMKKKSLARHEVVKGVNIIEGWLEYRNFIELRGAYNQIYECAGERKRFSLSLSQSLKIDQAQQQNYFLTDYGQSNQISLSNGLPQPNQESLVYTLEHNNESTRKEFTQSTLEKLPTLKHYPSTIKERMGKYEVQAQPNVQTSPVYRLKSLKSSVANQIQQINKSNPIKLDQQIFKNINISLQHLTESPMKKGFNEQSKEDNFVEKIAVNDDIRINLSSTDQHDDYSFQLPQTQPEHSRYSDVQNYKIDNTVHNPNYQLIVNYVPDQTVRKTNPIFSPVQQTPSKTQRHYLSPSNAATVSTPYFATQPIDPQRQKLVSQLQNDRIRIFAKSRPDLNLHRQNLIKSTVTPIHQLKQAVSASPVHAPNHASPIIVKDRRYVSPNMQSEKIFRSVVNNPKEMPTVVKLIEPLKYQKNNVPLNAPNKHQIVPPIKHQTYVKPRSPQVIKQLKGNSPVHILPQPQLQPHHSPQIVKIQTNQAKRISPQPQTIRQPNFILQQRPKVFVSPPPQARNIVHIEDYGLNQNPKQNPFIVRQNMMPQTHQIAYRSNQYQFTGQKKYISPPAKKEIVPQINQILIPPSQVMRQETVRAKSSASSPKLFFNYHPQEEHMFQEIVLHSHLSKNSSSLSRPKSMNSKLHVTLRKEH